MQRSSNLVLLLSLMLFCSCAGRQDKSELPATQPDITGWITQLTTTDKFRMRVEAEPGDSTHAAKAVVLVSPQARILERSGDELHTIKSEDLKEGDSVSVWFDGPVLMSYPMQAGAKIVVLEK
jgi:hypothetical protein